MTSTLASVESVKPIAELFTSTVSALWVTTFSIDLSLFNEFLLTRLGDSPLNVVVLADDRRLGVSLERIPPERADTLSAVNRKWLLRGMRLGGQAFHPKSYLAVSGTHATLLIGSGNLSSGGLDDGHEVFTTFRSGNPVGDAAIASWRSWTRRLVEMAADSTLAERFQDLNERLPTLPPVPDFGPILHNLDTPIAEQLTAAVMAETSEDVDELILAAPFYDDDADAVSRLLTDFGPSRVRVYVTGSTSVNGNRLAEQLTASGAQVEISTYEPDRFVHAKLVGIITGNRGWLLSGSPNLSRAALTLTPRDGGNVELAVLTSLDPTQVRDAFCPPSMRTLAGSLDTLASLSYTSDDESIASPVRLISATVTANERVELRSDPPAQSNWLLDDLNEHYPLTTKPSGQAVTNSPIPGRLVRLVDTDGAVLSNRVVVDDPTSLRAALTARDTRSQDYRPAELALGDLESPLGRAIVWLNRNLVMDVTESVNAVSTGGITPEEVEEQSDDDLWERLEREQIARDPRGGTYARMWADTSSSGTEPIIELLEVLRDRAPAASTPGRIGSSLLTHLLEQEPKAPTHQWSVSTRIRVRFRNVLRRWAAAQTDPRLVWVDRLAPAGNFAMIASVFVELHIERARNIQRVELTEEDLDDLWFRWLRMFVGTGEGDGWLDRLDPSDLASAQERFSNLLSENITVLCWLAVQPGHRVRDDVITWQPVLTAALARGLIDPTNVTARYLTEVTGRTITSEQLDHDFMNVIDFIDDRLWCSRAIADLALEDLTLQAPQTRTAQIQVRLDVSGILDPLVDPRVPRLIVAVLNYRGCDGVVLRAGNDYDADWRLVVTNGRPILYLPKGPDPNVGSIRSLVEVTAGILEELTGMGGTLASLFAVPQVA